MPSPSKENVFLELILENSPYKEWHFAELVRELRMSRAVTNKWLQKYVQEGLLFSRKKDKKFSYFTAGENNSIYHAYKKIYALEKIHKSGLFAKLLSLTKATTVILFGSQITGDWYKDSDLDIFILGNITDFNKKVYEKILNTPIEVHLFENKEEIRAIQSGLMNNIINGLVVKGRLQDVVQVFV